MIAQILRLFGRISILRHLDFVLPSFVHPDGFAIPVVGGQGPANLNRYEPWLRRALQMLLKAKDGAFIDVGANVGQSLLQLRAVDPRRPYFGFEPNVTAAAYVERLIRENGFNDTHIFSVGLSDHTSVGHLYFGSDYDSVASTVYGFRDPSHYRREKRVMLLKGDDVLESEGIGQVSIVKIDVEGGEREVLRGLDTCIATSRPFISCEVLPIYDEQSKIGKRRRSRADELQGFLASHRYTMYRLRHDGEIERLTQIETHGDLTLCEYLFIPDEDCSDIEESWRAGNPIA